MVAHIQSLNQSRADSNVIDVTKSMYLSCLYLLFIMGHSFDFSLIIISVRLHDPVVCKLRL